MFFIIPNLDIVKKKCGLWILKIVFAQDVAKALNLKNKEDVLSTIENLTYKV